MLKQRKLYEQQRDQLSQQQFNVEQTSFALQSMQDTKMQARGCLPPPARPGRACDGLAHTTDARVNGGCVFPSRGRWR